jgi:hypothetical protein
MSIYLTDKLRLVTNGVFLHWCAGCLKSHEIDVFNENHHCWTFNGNIDYPTFRPSMKIHDQELMVCHYNLVEGVVHYFGDCTHKLAGKSVALSLIPKGALLN